MAKMLEKCPRCGSDKIIRRVPLEDSYGDLGMRSRQAEVKVHGNPQAWVFKGRNTASSRSTSAASVDAPNFRSAASRRCGRSSRP